MKSLKHDKILIHKL